MSEGTSRGAVDVRSSEPASNLKAATVLLIVAAMAVGHALGVPDLPALVLGAVVGAAALLLALYTVIVAGVRDGNRASRES